MRCHRNIRIALSPDSGQERGRRYLFEGACAVWGVQAQVRFVTVFVFPSKKDPNMLDAAHVTGFVGLRRLSHRAWPLCYEAVHNQSGEAVIFEKLSLEGVGRTEGDLQLLHPFCDPANPTIEVSQSGPFKRFDLAPGPIGNDGLTTIVFGSYLSRLYPRYSVEPNTAGFLVMMQTPVERLIFDMFKHKDLRVDGPPPTQLLDRLTYPHVADESQLEKQSLPTAETPAGLPNGLSGAHTVHMPFYLKMLSIVSEKIHMPVEDFHGSRFEMTYPPISTTASRRFPLNPPPAGH